MARKVTVASLLPFLRNESFKTWRAYAGAETPRDKALVLISSASSSGMLIRILAIKFLLLSSIAQIGA